MNGHIRQKSLMVALAIVLLIAALRYGWSLLGFEGIPVAAQRAIPRREVPPSRAPADQLAVLRMADLDRVPGISAPGRDPWSFVDPPQKTATSRRSLPVLEVPPVAPASPVVRENPYPEFTLHYLGRFGPPEKQIAVFSDGGRVFNRLEGSVIDRRFVVERIGYESVDIRYVDFPDAPAKRIGVSPHR